MAPWEKYQQKSGPWAKYGAQPADPVTTPKEDRQAPPSYGGGMVSALTEGSQAGIFGGFDDEITAGMLAPIDAGIDWMRGKGFDMGAAYTRKQKMLDDQKAARREEHPVASIAGEITGGLAVPGLARGVSAAAAPANALSGIGKGALSGAGYGAVYGAGEARPGERLEGAAQGAALGAATGGAIGGVGGALAGRASRKAAQAMAPTTDDLAAQAGKLYQQSEAQGVRFTGNSVNRLKNKLKYVAGGINDKLRPKTAGTVGDVDNVFNGKPISLEAFDEFRKGINLDLKTAQGTDKLHLSRMKRALDEFADTVSPTDMTGGPQGIEMLKQARKTWAQHKKAETIETILDAADVKTGQFTQSGFANAIKTEMRGLYKAIQKGRAQGWTKEETELIRQMAKGGSPSGIVNVFAKFAPRGVVSIGAGQLVGSTLPGVGNIAVPVLGHLAGKAADTGALRAATTLRNAAAAGVSPAALPSMPNKLMPLIPAASEAAVEANRAIRRR